MTFDLGPGTTAMATMKETPKKRSEKAKKGKKGAESEGKGTDDEKDIQVFEMDGKGPSAEFEEAQSALDERVRKIALEELIRLFSGIRNDLTELYMEKYDSRKDEEGEEKKDNT